MRSKKTIALWVVFGILFVADMAVGVLCILQGKTVPGCIICGAGIAIGVLITACFGGVKDAPSPTEQSMGKQLTSVYGYCHRNGGKGEDATLVFYTKKMAIVQEDRVRVVPYEDITSKMDEAPNQILMVIKDIGEIRMVCAAAVKVAAVKQILEQYTTAK